MFSCTYDSAADAAYITLGAHVLPGEASRQYPCDPDEVDGEIILDFNEQGQLLGIEVLNASMKLRPSFLDRYKIPFK
jgi:uncharacterized protein YuzE